MINRLGCCSPPIFCLHKVAAPASPSTTNTLSLDQSQFRRVSLKKVAAIVFAFVSYLSKGQHLVRSVLEDDRDLRQVGGALPEQTLQRAVGWSKEGQLRSKLLHPVLHLAGRRVRGVQSHTQSSVSTDSLRADVL